MALRVVKPREAAKPLNFIAMIIDLILDRRAGVSYFPADFYFSVLQYRRLTPEDSDRITRAMDGESENAVRAALCTYCANNGYFVPDIINYINSVAWLPDWWDKN